ncbi:heme exporter protein CcmB [Zooshikella sp. WH53]|uniref:Heme exporter protein B n=2 Tax=Zooshikella harenae TaxID=2827238 RepID=A0ABS5ZHP1_9GAMM|nr:heme exporter protein CcmB [Zooshikella harenae]
MVSEINAPASTVKPMLVSPGAAVWVTLCRDLRLGFRRQAELINPPLFFLIVVTLFPLGISPDPDFLAKLAPGVIWIAALLATLLAMDSLFRGDYEDGALDLLLVVPQPLFMHVLAKVCAHWLLTGLPLLILAPMLALMLSLPSQAYMTLIASLALGTPLLSLLGAIGAALTVGIRRGGMLLSLLILPLYIPVLLLGTGAVVAASEGLPADGQLLWLAVLLTLGLTLAPFAIAAGLRITASG